MFDDSDNDWWDGFFWGWLMFGNNGNDIKIKFPPWWIILVSFSVILAAAILYFNL